MKTRKSITVEDIEKSILEDLAFARDRRNFYAIEESSKINSLAIASFNGKIMALEKLLNHIEANK